MAADRWLLALSLGFITACGGSPSPDAGVAPLPTPRPAQQTDASSPGLDLTPLPSTQQVMTAVPQGRPDPFAPPPVLGSTGSRPSRKLLQLPSDLRLQGVIVTQGRPRALVERGDRSGTLEPGDRGVAGSDGLLPPGWTVAGINARDCVLTLRQGKLTAAVSCPRMGL